MPEVFGHPSALVAFGLFVGFLGSLVGLGGGFVMVPYFAQLLGWPHPLTVGTSLAVVVANAASGVTSFTRQRRIDFMVGSVLGVATLPGTVLGKLVNERLSGAAFKMAFAAVVIAAAVLLAWFRAENRPGLAWFRRGARRRLVDAAGTEFEYTLNLGSAVALSVALGFVSALFGLGGGFLLVPMLALLYGVPLHVAMATSQYVLLITAAAGGVAYAVDGHVDVPVFLWMGAAGVAGAQAGSYVAARSTGRALRWILAGALLAMAVWMGVDGWRESA